ncbi:Reticulon-4-interacting protein 1 [Phytophthora cinnamomi]|nr:Reticulon-4-interacting protein 1 [Phytophthora cinnamomi]
MPVVAFEYRALTEIPASLLSLQVFTLSLKGNRIEAIPQLEDMPPGPEVPELSLTENPLKQLPDRLGTPTTFIDRLDLQGTNLSTLPAWTQTQVRKANYMHGTPNCAMVAPELQPANVQCGPRSVLDLNLDFPLMYIDEIYAVDRG